MSGFLVPALSSDADLPSAGASGSAPFAGPTTPQAQLTPAVERRKVLEQEALDQAAGGLQEGKHYYLINRRWYVEWLQWVGHSSAQSPKLGPSQDLVFSELEDPSLAPQLCRQKSWTKDRPGPIDNANLLDSNSTGALKRDITEHDDYEILSEGVWELLHGWYQGGPAIPRLAIARPTGVVIELHGLTLKLYRTASTPESESIAITESKATTVATFKKRACRELGLDPDKTRIWDFYNGRRYTSLEDSADKSLDDCRIYDDNPILLEQKRADGTWPPDDNAVRVSSTNNEWNSREDAATQGTPPARGVVGLQNLGNTCFMNSAIQCLSNVPDLRDFFLKDQYKANLNSGAFKTKGKLAESYAKLLHQLWDPNTVQVAPRNFKWQIGQFAEQFAGYGQQDSMEFIEYVIDGLKEDVNLVQGSKPFVELKEAEGRDDTVVAAEACRNYHMRNESLVDDLFLGFFKSTVTCPEPGCGRVSVTFDPFLSVKLPLVSAAEDRTASFDVLIVPKSPTGPIQKHRVSVAKFGNANNLIEAAAKELDLEASNCILTEIYSKKIYKFFERTDSVESIGLTDTLVLYEFEDATEFQMSAAQRWGPPGSAAPDARVRCGIIIHHRQAQATQRVDLLGIPLAACVNQQISGHDLNETVRSLMKKYLGPDVSEEWKLFRTGEKWGLLECHQAVEDNDEVINLDWRQYLIVEWKEGVEVPEALTRLEKDSGNSGSRKPSSVELDSCFQMFTETDKLSEMDTWWCSRCKDHREAFKKMEFWALPPVLVLQLKRFTYNQYSRERLDTAVAFPLEGLDLGRFSIQPDGAHHQVYDLVSVSKHMGGLGGGHYVAYARSSEDGRWYYYNDSSVSEATPAQVAEDQVGAYVLFYIRRDRRPEAWGPPA